VSSKKYRKNLRKEMSSEDRAPSQNNAEPIQGEKQSANERYYPPPFPSSIEVQFPIRVEENYNATQKKQDTREKRRIILEALTIFLVSCSLVISWYMWNEMRKAEAAKLSADAAIAATSAWIAVVGLAYKGAEQDRLTVEFVMKNVGKTRAIETGAEWQFAFLPGPGLNQVPKFEAYQCPDSTTKPGILDPDGK
jgi:hypothetical protein